MDVRLLAPRSLQVRGYRPTDRAIVRSLCCDTGFLGNPIDPVFQDRELFADFLTGYYLQHEPDSTFVATLNNEIKGYLLGSRQPLKHQIYSISQNLVLAAKGFTRYFRYRPESRRFLHWIMLNAWREVPAAPRRTGHFHINLLPEARSIEVCRLLLETYLRFLYENGVKRVYGQVVTFDNRRGAKLFERYGFKVMNRSEITKYKRFTNKNVYLCTVVKELEEQSDRLLYPSWMNRRTDEPTNR
jgi:ribosomal protein S18 acetylase RimI-like enzyme